MLQTCVEWSDCLVDAGNPYGACALGGSDPPAICWGRHCEIGPVCRSLDAEQPHGMGDPDATWKRSQQTSLWADGYDNLASFTSTRDMWDMVRTGSQPP